MSYQPKLHTSQEYLDIEASERHRRKFIGNSWPPWVAFAERVGLPIEGMVESEAANAYWVKQQDPSQATRPRAIMATEWVMSTPLLVATFSRMAFTLKGGARARARCILEALVVRALPATAMHWHIMIGGW